MTAPQTDRTARRGIALSIEAFEALGFAFREQHESDYGIDAHVEFIEDDKATGRLLAVQVKTGESYFSESTGNEYVFRADATHIEYWINHALPVIVCLADLDNKVAYWQVITGETAESTGSGYKVLVPKNHKVNVDSLPALRDMLTMVIPQERYTLLNTDDVSLGTAKRYSFKAALNSTFSKSETASLVRQMTAEGAKRRYHRNHLVERRWGDSDAEVVWAFVYPSMTDYANNNYYCRGLWINPSLPENQRPVAFSGENVGDGTIVDWNPNYSQLAEMFSMYEATKEEYLAAAGPLIEDLGSLIQYFHSALDALSSGQVQKETFLRQSQHQLDRATSIDTQVGDLPGAPYECKEVDNLLQQIAASVANVPILYSQRSAVDWSDASRLFQASEQVQDAGSSMEALRYELRKIK